MFGFDFRQAQGYRERPVLSRTLRSVGRIALSGYGFGDQIQDLLKKTYGLIEAILMPIVPMDHFTILRRDRFDEGENAAREALLVARVEGQPARVAHRNKVAERRAASAVVGDHPGVVGHVKRAVWAESDLDRTRFAVPAKCAPDCPPAG